VSRLTILELFVGIILSALPPKLGNIRIVKPQLPTVSKEKMSVLSVLLVSCDFQQCPNSSTSAKVTASSSVQTEENVSVVGIVSKP